MTAIAIVGSSGRMGHAILELADESEDYEVVAGIEDPSDPTVGTEVDPGGVPVTSDFEEAYREASVAIDFSVPEACATAARAAARFDCALVSGTTGLSDAQTARIESAAEEAPILRASNFSVGINLLMKLVEDASAATEGDFDIEIFEGHHRNKVDAPSGTALSLGEVAAFARGWNLDEVAEWGRHGDVGERDDAEIGFQVLRGGSIAGEHTVALCGPDEQIELTHRAADRSIFAQGALRAAAWLEGRENGLYDMQDVLFGG